MATEPEVSIILPCRNEAAALPGVLAQIKNVLAQHHINGEIIVSDSSSDRSPDIARAAGVHLIKHDQAGYGNAYRHAFPHARGRHVFCADADGSYDFNELPRFIAELKKGADLVVGNRFAGRIAPNAMPPLHRYLGTPLLSLVLRLLFGTSVHDSQCGMRALTHEALKKLNLHTTGMEFASEMIIKAQRARLRIKELPINYLPRQGTSKLRTFPDGWRHLRLMLLYSPNTLFLIPGIASTSAGLLSMIWLTSNQPVLFGLPLFFHPMFISALLTIGGYQLIIFALFAQIYATTYLNEPNPSLANLFRYITLERALIAGGIILIVGLVFFISILTEWLATNFGALHEVKRSVIALTAVTVGLQTIFSGFMFALLGMPSQPPKK